MTTEDTRPQPDVAESLADKQPARSSPPAPAPSDPPAAQANTAEAVDNRIDTQMPAAACQDENMPPPASTAADAVAVGGNVPSTTTTSTAAPSAPTGFSSAVLQTAGPKAALLASTGLNHPTPPSPRALNLPNKVALHEQVTAAPPQSSAAAVGRTTSGRISSHTLSISSPALGPGPNQALLDSPVLLPVVTAEASPTTGFTHPIPLFANTLGPTVVSPSKKSWRVPPSALGQDGKQGQNGAMPPPASPGKGGTPGPAQRQAVRGAEDGYQWRKYGEKMVKGSPYPRSYYKCSFPGCPVKKIVERDRHSGLIKENLYKGQHTHPMPAPGKLSRAVANAAHKNPSNGPAAAVLAKQAAHAVAAINARAASASAAQSAAKSAGQTPMGDKDFKLDVESSGSKQALETLHKEGSFTFSSFTSTPLMSMEALEGLSNGSSGLKSSSMLPVEPLSRSTSSSLLAGSSAPPALSAMLKGSGLDDVTGLTRLGQPSSAMVKGMDADNAELVMIAQAALANASKMRVARAAEQKNALRHSAPAGTSVQISTGPSPTGSSMPAPTAAPPKKRKSSGSKSDDNSQKEDDEPQGPPESPDVVPERLAAMYAQGTPGSKDARLMLLLKMDVDTLDDGYKWRKYGQKLVKGNKFPRSYYKCTHPECTVRKHLERSGKDNACVVATYEGIHTHSLPVAGTVPVKRSAARRASDEARRQAGKAKAAAAAAAAAADTPAPSASTIARPEGALPLIIPGSPMTPKARKVAVGAALPIIRLPEFDGSSFPSLDDPSSALKGLDAMASPSQLGLTPGSEKRQKLMPFASFGGHLASPGNPNWDVAGLLSTPKSPGNVALPTPPSSLTPPPGLDLPSSSLGPLQPAL